jgi:RNA polymerase sigma factor (sigma-70 family)
VLPDPTTDFVRRLRSRDPAAWFELWENFGPILRGQLARWGRGRIGPETVKDLSQETLTALSDAIDRHDPSRGARFSTWLLAIARHSLCGEMDRRNAQKRGSGRRSASLDETGGWMSSEPGPDASYEQAVFDAKVVAALRAAERECGFADFAIFRQRVFEGRSGREVAEALALSEATVSRRLAAVRARVRARLVEVFAKYSFSAEEWAELSCNGLDPNPTKGDEASFDAAVADVFQRFTDRGATGSPEGTAPAREGRPGSLARVVRSLLPRGESLDREEAK